MLILHRALGIYRYIIIAWAVMTWIPGIRGSAIHHIVGLPVEPVLNLFSFASVGPIGFAPMILLGVIWGLEVWIEGLLKAQSIDPYESSEHGEDEE